MLGRLLLGYGSRVDMVGISGERVTSCWRNDLEGDVTVSREVGVVTVEGMTTVICGTYTTICGGCMGAGWAGGGGTYGAWLPLVDGMA